MEFSFEINTIATVEAEVARKAAKRKRNSTVKDPESVKQQKFNNGAPFTATSPSRCSRELVALNEEVETQEQQTPKRDSVLTKTPSPRTKCKRLSTIKEQGPSEQQKLDDVSPPSSSTQSEKCVLIEEAETFDQRAPKHSSISATTSSSQAECDPVSTIEAQVPSEQQMPNDSSLLSTSSQPKTSTLTEEANTSEQQAPKRGSSSQAERKPPSTVEAQVPSEQQELNDSPLLSTSSQPKSSTLPEEAKPSEQQAPDNGSSSQAKRARQVTLEDQMPRKQQKLDHDSPLSISSQPKSSTLPEEAKPSEQQAPDNGSSSQAKRARQITIEDELPSKQRKLNDGSSLSTSSQSDSSLHSLADVPLSNPSSRSPLSSRKTSGISTPAHVTSSNSASRSSTPAEANPRKGGRPRVDKQFPRQKELRVRTKLRTNRPVKNEIPFEVWQSILEFCPLEFLLKAVNIAHFKDILLRNEHVWKAARLNQFGHDMPDPPPGISEYKYANLLTGSGCHGCGDKLTRRVYWGFVRRWCDNCLSKNVDPLTRFHAEYEFRDNKEKGDFFDKIVQCIPDVKYDKWHHYAWVGDYEEPPVWAKIYPNGQHSRFSRARFSGMEERVRNSSLNSSSTEEEIDAFFAPYIADNKAYVERLQQIEGWSMTHRLFNKSELAALKGDRETNFKERALSMNPPLQIEALELCPSYQRAKKIASPFTEKVWSVLKTKLDNERAAAEAELAELANPFPFAFQPGPRAVYF